MARRLRAGDHRALDELVDRHDEHCIACAIAFTGRDRAFAEDAAQDAWLRLIRKCPAFENDEHVLRWLRTAVRSACIDRLRAESRRIAREHESHRNRRDIDPQHMDHIRQQIADLPEQERDLLARRFDRERSLQQISAELGLSRDAVKGRLARTLARLSSVLRSEP